MIKKLLCVLLTFTFLFSLVCIAKAESENSIYFDSVSGNEELFELPVKIGNNTGFMGFSIIVTYDADDITPVSVKKGNILSGMFNDSIETSKDNSFKVMFSSSGDVTADGLLFTLYFKAKNSSFENSKISLSYSQQDTFNEKWDEVKLECSNIIITLSNGSVCRDTTVTTSGDVDSSSSDKTTESNKETENTTIPEETTTTKPVTESTAEPIITEKSSVRIKGFVSERTVDYRTTITFYPLVENARDIKWYITGAEGYQNEDDSFTVSNVTSNFSVYCTAKDNMGNEIKSETENVTVKTNFIAKLIAFFRSLLGRLPVIEQR